jgi:hypothetical protein
VEERSAKDEESFESAKQDSLCLFLPVRDCIDRPAEVSDPGPDMLDSVEYGGLRHLLLRQRSGVGGRRRLRKRTGWGGCKSRRGLRRCGPVVEDCVLQQEKKDQRKLLPHIIALVDFGDCRTGTKVSEEKRNRGVK